MLKVKNFSILFTALALVVVPFFSAKTVSAEETTLYTLESSFTLFAEGLDKKDLFDLVSDPLNDHLWYPGVISTELVEEGTENNSPVGNKYLQTIDIGIGFPIYLNLEILEYSPNSRVVLKGEGLQSFVATYTFKNVPGGATWNMESTLTAPFIDIDGLAGLINFAHSNIALIFGVNFTSTVDYAYFI